MQFIHEMKPSKALVIGLFLTLLFCGVKAKGQTRLWLSRNNVMVEGRVHYGFFYHHHFEMERFNAHYGAIELSVLRKTFGNMEWEADYRYPYVGLTFTIPAWEASRSWGRCMPSTLSSTIRSTTTPTAS